MIAPIRIFHIQSACNGNIKRGYTEIKDEYWIFFSFYISGGKLKYLSIKNSIGLK